MEIFIVKTAGFCFGVKRAINMAYDAAKEAPEHISTLGPIIHNPQVVSELEKSNIFAKSDINEIQSGTVIIRSHGITLDEMENVENRKLKIVDATCPFVKKAQEYVKMLTAEGYFIVVIGEKEHPEVKGIVSYAGKNVAVLGSKEDVINLPRVKRLGIVAQTTQSLENFQEIVSLCLNKAGEIKIFNTICNATNIRQKESTELASRVDCMLVVGGKNSANTNRLTEVCKRIQPNTYHIEVSEEIKEAWFKGVKGVGITAGASTPEWIIKDVLDTVKHINCKAEKLLVSM
ncbi:MAG: 4-hydroxy-3-methylbut-2-enyl diphosphate reductase [Deltaproteobacteria bacterium]|nr:4-hydroxy-3-methylbut-2-enyl diphosphate reductase [Deltaproteobacteria bacterium]